MERVNIFSEDRHILGVESLKKLQVVLKKFEVVKLNLVCRFYILLIKALGVYLGF